MASGSLDLTTITAPNPGPMTLTGTNTYLVGRNPTLVIDPGPADESHVEIVLEAIESRGGHAGVILTHGHGDHSDSLGLMRETAVLLEDSIDVGGLQAVATPGHATDHFCLILDPGHPAHGDESVGRVIFVGDLLLGTGSGLVPPRSEGGSLADYLDSLQKVRDLEPDLLYPGHGPVIEDPTDTIAAYIQHRLDREGRLIEALESGERSRARLLDLVWDDVPAELRPAAALAMQAHLEKLIDDGVPGADSAD
jgi:glyoxylase-like metal-dependent hydrolase (beta-lactamase superfamily II)